MNAKTYSTRTAVCFEMDDRNHGPVKFKLYALTINSDGSRYKGWTFFFDHLNKIARVRQPDHDSECGLPIRCYESEIHNRVRWMHQALNTALAEQLRLEDTNFEIIA